MPLFMNTEGMTKIVPLWINGASATSTPEITFPVFSAEQEKVVYLAQSADSQTAAHAADVAWKAFATWRHVNAVTRREILLRAADILESRKDELVRIQREETSCQEGWARINTNFAVRNLREIASRVTSVTGQIPQLEGEGQMALIFKEPIGPVLCIPPWNASVILSTRGIATILAAGCTVVVKASELCPRTHHFLTEVFTEAGVPAGVLNMVQVRREEAAVVTETLIAHRAIQKVEFIGSAAIGTIIGQLGAKYLKPVLMELGGKCSAIVLDDADLDDAAHKCVLGAFLHHGQICFSTERIIVHESVAQEFITLLIKEATGFDAGSGVTKDLASKACAKLVEAEEKGAKFIVGGPQHVGAAGLRPSLVTGVTKNMTIFDEETFGPSAAVYIVKDDEEAIQIANDSEYGLNAAIHTRDMYRGVSMGRRLEVGQVHINSLTENDEPTLPVGGTKKSGWGRNNGLWGIEEYLVEKLITVNMKGAKMTFETGDNAKRT